MASVGPSSEYVYVLEPRSEAGANMPVPITRKLRRSCENKCGECRRWNIFGRERIRLLADLHCPADAVAVEAVTGVCLLHPRLHQILKPFSNEFEIAEIQCEVKGRVTTRIAWSALRDRRCEIVYPYWVPYNKCTLCGRYWETPNPNSMAVAIRSTCARGDIFQGEGGFIVVSERVVSSIKGARVSSVVCRGTPVVESVAVELADGSVEVIQ